MSNFEVTSLLTHFWSQLLTDFYIWYIKFKLRSCSSIFTNAIHVQMPVIGSESWKMWWIFDGIGIFTPILAILGPLFLINLLIFTHINLLTKEWHCMVNYQILTWFNHCNSDRTKSSCGFAYISWFPSINTVHVNTEYRIRDHLPKTTLRFIYFNAVFLRPSSPRFDEFSLTLGQKWQLNTAFNVCFPNCFTCWTIAIS